MIHQHITENPKIPFDHSLIKSRGKLLHVIDVDTLRLNNVSVKSLRIPVGPRSDQYVRKALAVEVSVADLFLFPRKLSLIHF